MIIFAINCGIFKYFIKEFLTRNLRKIFKDFITQNVDFFQNFPVKKNKDSTSTKFSNYSVATTEEFFLNIFLADVLLIYIDFLLYF